MQHFSLNWQLIQVLYKCRYCSFLRVSDPPNFPKKIWIYTHQYNMEHSLTLTFPQQKVYDFSLRGQKVFIFVLPSISCNVYLQPPCVQRSLCGGDDSDIYLQAVYPRLAQRKGLGRVYLVFLWQRFRRPLPGVRLLGQFCFVTAGSIQRAGGEVVASKSSEVMKRFRLNQNSAVPLPPPPSPPRTISAGIGYHHGERADTKRHDIALFHE